MQNLKQVIIPVSYFTFVDPKLEESKEWFLCISYKISMHLPLYSNWSKYNFEISDFERYNGKLRSLVFNVPSNTCDSLGWGLGFSLAERNENWEKQSQKRVLATTLQLNQRADEVEKIFDEIIEFCFSRNIDCIFVTTPVWYTYRNLLNRTQLNDMKHRIKNIKSKYGIAYYDMFTDSCFTNEDFHDVDHLSDVGAAKFTYKLRKVIERN